jgi:hypothetical protein
MNMEGLGHSPIEYKETDLGRSLTCGPQSRAPPMGRTKICVYGCALCDVREGVPLKELVTQRSG